MVEAVADFDMFHIGRALSYNRHSTLSVGQVLEIGHGHNPFFDYYETPPMLQVRLQDGSVTSLNPIHWLENVRNGAINPDNLPVAAHDIAKHFQTLSRELIMELARLQHAPTAPSRQVCLWAAETSDGGSRWKARLGGQGALVHLKGTGTIHRADAALLSADAEPMSLTMDKARRYWLGEQSDTPEPELLFVGQVIVTSIETP